MGCDMAAMSAGVQRFSSCAARLWSHDAAILWRLISRRAGWRPVRHGSGAGAPSPPPAVWNPAADYITAGQDEPGYRSWYLAAPWRAGQVKAFNDYLTTYQVGRHRADLAAVPDRDGVGEMRRAAVRNPADQRMAAHRPDAALHPRLCDPGGRPGRSRSRAIATRASNQCAGGAPESAHKHYSAIDLVPLRPITREAADEDLVRRATRGAAPDYQVGLGFYAFLRFHVDTTKFRRWNMDPAVARAMPADRPSGGYRHDRPAAAAACRSSIADTVPPPQPQTARLNSIRTTATETVARHRLKEADPSGVVCLTCNTISAARQGIDDGFRKAHRPRPGIPPGGADDRGSRASPAHRAGAFAEGVARRRAGHGRGPDQGRRRRSKAAQREADALVAKIPAVTGSGATQAPALDGDTIRILDQAEQIAKKAGDSYVTVERILLAMALAKNTDVGGALAKAGLTPQNLNAAIDKLRGGRTADTQGAEDRYDALKKYARDLTEAAREGKLDPVIGRDEEIRRTIQVLARRTKNNPVLIGEPGVGKTAIAEGLAVRIANGDVPDGIKDKSLLALDLGLDDRRREISRRVRGAAEGRARRGAPGRRRHHPVHRRDAHAGRRRKGRRRDGRRRTCSSRRSRAASCTASARPRSTNIASMSRRTRRWSGASSRCSSASRRVPDTISILRGLKEKYELHHGVRITDAAIVAAATLGNRYITDRFLPDKAIDLMDEAASRIRMEVEFEARGDRESRPADHPAQDRARGAEEGAGQARRRIGSPSSRRSSPTSSSSRPS